MSNLQYGPAAIASGCLQPRCYISVACCTLFPAQIRVLIADHATRSNAETQLSAFEENDFVRAVNYVLRLPCSNCFVPLLVLLDVSMSLSQPNFLLQMVAALANENNPEPQRQLAGLMLKNAVTAQVWLLYLCSAFELHDVLIIG